MKWVHQLEDCLEELYVNYKKAYAFLVQICFAQISNVYYENMLTNNKIVCYIVAVVKDKFNL